MEQRQRYDQIRAEERRKDGNWISGTNHTQCILNPQLHQIPAFGVNNQHIGYFDYSNEMKALGVNLDLMKGRAQDVITSYRHSLSSGAAFDPAVE